MLLKPILSFLFLTLLMALSKATALLPRVGGDGNDDPAEFCHAEIMNILDIPVLPEYCAYYIARANEGLDTTLYKCRCLADYVEECYTNDDFEESSCGMRTLVSACEECGCTDCFSKFVFGG